MSNSIPSSTLEKFTTFGDLLRFLRRRVGITQMELATAVGYSDAQISRLEQNLRLPDIPTIEARFVSALDLDDEPKAVARLLDLAANVRREDAPGLGLCPYKGLNYFDEIDADLFAGREALTSKLRERVLAFTSNDQVSKERFLAIIGASGSGKSSLVRAGLVPALRWNKVSANWPIYVFTPTARPLESLAMSITDDAGSASATMTLIDDMARETRSLNLYLKRALKGFGASHTLLVVDQFEELFTLCRSEEEQKSFIENLLIAADEVGGSAIIVITLRADFYAQCAVYPQFRESLAQQQEYIGAMNHEELHRAIDEPARRGRWELEPGLVDLLLHDVGNEPGALPLLSHALMETWQRRRGRMLTLSGYTSSGGVRGAIAETAETVFVDKFTHEQQAIARRIFLRLTEPGNESTASDTRRLASLTELFLKPGDALATQMVLKELADARLITTSENYAEVAHEALIREWPRLRDWIEDNREYLRLHRNLTETAREWLASNRDPDTLFRGARLAQAREWASANENELNELEREFLAASIDLSECEAAEREAQHQRELEAVQKLVEVEKQRADLESQRAEEHAQAARQLRLRAFYLASAFVLALAMALIALYYGAQARQQAALALDAQRFSLSRELAAAATSNLEIDPERSILLAMDAVSITKSIDKTWPAEAEDALRSALQASRVQFTLRGHTHRVWALAYSPDGSQLATASDDGTVKVWDARSGQELLSIPTNATLGRHGLAFSPDGKRLASTGSVGTVKVWDANTGEALLTVSGHTDWVSAVAFSPDEKWLATAGEDRTAMIWDAVTGKALKTFVAHTDQVTDVAFSPDGKRLATSSLDETVRVWDTTTGENLSILTGHTQAVNGLAYSRDGKQLATVSDDKTAIIWDTTTGQKLLTLNGHTDGLLDLAFSPDGLRLATASYDTKVKIWNTSTGQELLAIHGHTGPVSGVAFSPDCDQELEALVRQCGSNLASASWDGLAKVWNTSFSRELLTLSVPTATASAASPNGLDLAAGFPNGSVKLWDLSSGLEGNSTTVKELATFLDHTGSINGVAFSPDSKRLASSSNDDTIIVWDTATNTILLTIHGHTGGSFPLVFSPDGLYLATTSNDQKLQVWDATTGQAVFSKPLITWSYGIAFSPDGTHLAAALNDGTAKVWDFKTGVESLTVSGHGANVWSIAYNPDGTRLATASQDGTAKVWDAATGQELITFRGHTGSVNSVSYSSDGKHLATAGQDGIAKVWDAATGQELQTLHGSNDPVTGVTFSLNGKRLLTTSSEGMLRFYLLRMEDLMALGQKRVTRALTSGECRQFLHLPMEQCPADSPTKAQISMIAPATNPSIIKDLSARGKVCELTDTAGVNDQFYNQIAFHGVQQTARQYGWEIALIEPQQSSDYSTNITQMLKSNCDLIIAPTGLYFNDAISIAAKVNPSQKFQVFEWKADPPLDNVWEQNYAVEQAAFLAGYVAASVTKTGKVATFGGAALPHVTNFMDGFARGVDYYNQKNGKKVQVLGWDIETQDGLFAGNFMNTEDGRKMAKTLLDQGADIIMPVAGRLGLGAAAEVKERGNATIIGVDTDWVQIYPEYTDIILTSIQKRLDASVLQAIQSIIDGTFKGGAHTGTLENGGVSLAPFHSLDVLVSAKVKADLEQIKAEIITGAIKTN